MSIHFDALKPSASMEVTRLAGELKKAGRTVYPLSAGDTHFPPPECITRKLNNLPPAYSHYTNAEGIPQVREQIAKKYPGYTSSDILLVPGLKQGIYYALAALDLKTLCIPEPAWLGYEASAVLAGYSTVSVNTYQTDWLTTLAQTPFDCLLLCSPNNPDGRIYSPSEMEHIVRIAESNKAWIITDYIYDRYIFDGLKSPEYPSLMKYSRLIIGNGFSKSHAMTGFRIGYIMLKDELLKQRILTIQQNLATCVPAISQYILTDIAEADAQIDAYSTYYQTNRDLVLQYFPEWGKHKPAGGFYFFVDLTPYGISDGQKFCEYILQQEGIALVPGAAYGKGFDSYVRLSFSIDRQELESALKKLRIHLHT